MRTIIVLASIVFLSGCQSDFDKCMETEAPRAGSILALNDMATNITAFKSTSNFFVMMQQGEVIFETERAESEPAGYPASPSYPPYTCSLDEMSSAVWQVCYDAHEERVKIYEGQKPAAKLALQEWNARPDVVAWKEKNDTVLLAVLREVGLDIKSLEEVDQRVEEQEAAYIAALQNRAIESDCWGDGADDCYDPIDSEVKSKFGADDLSWEGYLSKRVEVSKLAAAEILVKMTSDYGLAVNRADELAVLTCNQNGLYE